MHTLLDIETRFSSLMEDLRAPNVEAAVRKAASNKAAVEQIKASEPLSRRLRQLSIPLDNALGGARNTEDIYIDVRRAEAAKKLDQQRGQGKLAFMAREHGGLRVLPSGAMYVMDEKTGTWRRIKGEAAVVLRKELELAQQQQQAGPGVAGRKALTTWEDPKAREVGATQ